MGGIAVAGIAGPALDSQSPSGAGHQRLPRLVAVEGQQVGLVPHVDVDVHDLV